MTFTEHSVDTIQFPGWIVNPSPDNPVPAITHLAPAAVASGGPGFLLYLTGSGFTGSSVARIAGVDRVTTYHSPTQLVAAVLAADIATPGAKAVQVFNPAPAGGLSVAATLTAT